MYYISDVIIRTSNHYRQNNQTEIKNILNLSFKKGLIIVFTKQNMKEKKTKELLRVINSWSYTNHIPKNSARSKVREDHLVSPVFSLKGVLFIINIYYPNFNFKRS